MSLWSYLRKATTDDIRVSTWWDLSFPQLGMKVPIRVNCYPGRSTGEYHGVLSEGGLVIFETRDKYRQKVMQELEEAFLKRFPGARDIFYPPLPKTALERILEPKDLV